MKKNKIDLKTAISNIDKYAPDTMAPKMKEFTIACEKEGNLLIIIFLLKHMPFLKF